jgi:S-adenosylmethionine decarboxylase
VPNLGEEWIVDAGQCDPALLRDLEGIRAMLAELTTALALNVVKDPLFHKFDGEGGITGLFLLGESHLACHTYPEHQSLTLNLYSCRPKPAFGYEALLSRHVGAKRVVVRRVDRGVSDAARAVSIP